MRFYFLFVFMIACHHNSSAQHRSAFRQYDEIFGPANSGIYNGTLHFDSYFRANETHRFFGKNTYSMGDITYDGQFYAGVEFKYDLLDDVLVVKLPGNENNAGINLIAEKTTSFTIANREFVNLETDGKTPGHIRGFHQQLMWRGNVSAFVRYSKQRIEVLTNQKVLSKYVDSETYVMRYGDQWKIIRSERDMIELFPDLSARISEFYSANAVVSKSNPQVFLGNLAEMIYNAINQTNRK